MKRMGKALVTVAMMLGAMAMAGCQRSSDERSEPVAPVETPAAAPVVEQGGEGAAKPEAAKPETPKPEAASKASAANPGFEQDAVRFGVGARVGGPRYYAPHAPPPVRVEHRGQAPSHRHFWANGYWRWSGRQYTWMGGRWEVQRPRHTYHAPRWVAAGPRWQYVPGHWERRS